MLKLWAVGGSRLMSAGSRHQEGLGGLLEDLLNGIDDGHDEVKVSSLPNGDCVEYSSKKLQIRVVANEAVMNGVEVGEEELWLGSEMTSLTETKRRRL
jgi:hypothetical protein